jgi:hypothetical protein
MTLELAETSIYYVGDSNCYVTYYERVFLYRLACKYNSREARRKIRTYPGGISMNEDVVNVTKYPPFSCLETRT